MPEVVTYAREQDIALITIDNPPVNAMSWPVRRGLWEAVERFERDGEARAAVLMCAGKTFIAGADITEFDRPPEDPWLPDVVARLEQSSKPIIAAIHGTALGGGLETALGCHYRCALSTAKVGLPEVNLGLLPGAGGTQRLPRLIGVEGALEMIITGRHVGASEARDAGILDVLIEAGDLREGAIRYTKELLESGAPIRRISEMELDASGLAGDFFTDYRGSLEKDYRGFYSPFRILDAVQGAVELPFEEGMKLERRLFDECKASDQSRAQRALFFAERNIGKIPDIPRETPAREIQQAAVIGAGTMGGGIAMCFANAGIPVYLLDTQREALERGLESIRKNYASTVKKGRLSEDQMHERLALIQGVLEDSEMVEADVVVEAVFENMEVKKEVFRRLDGVCKKGAILATNTSTLDVDAIAEVTARPEDVIGLHFFAPANVMRLLEIVRGRYTGNEAVTTAVALARRLGKNGVVVGVCFGFVGNRMFFPYLRESQMMMLEGVPPERIDHVARDWGMAMGPNGVMDLSGLDVMHKVIMEWKDKPDDPAFFRIVRVLYEMGRYGQKTGAGIFRYEGRSPQPDPEVAEMVKREAEMLGIPERDIDDEEIIERLFYSMINEGALILEEGIALRPGDIDVVWTSGYGMPRYRGGPMIYADRIGPARIYEAVLKYRDRYGDRYWRPAPLLERLAQEGGTFAGCGPA